MRMTETPRPEISVIIPALDEAGVIQSTIRSATPEDPAVEVLVVDGGSGDATPRLAAAAGATVLQTSPGRAAQMNAGAAAARGELLLFLHADTRLPPRFRPRVIKTLAAPSIVAGAFELGIDAPGWPFRAIEAVSNFRARFRGLPYGDQALFVPADAFHAVGGFPELPIMEDYELMRQLRRRGRIALIGPAVRTSPRRWRTIGPWRLTLLHQAIILGYHLGLDPGRLARWRSPAREPAPHARSTRDLPTRGAA